MKKQERAKLAQEKQLNLIKAKVQVSEQLVHSLVKRLVFPVAAGLTAVPYEFVSQLVRDLLIAFGAPRSDFFFTDIKDSHFNQSRAIQYLMTFCILLTLYYAVDSVANWYFLEDYNQLRNKHIDSIEKFPGLSNQISENKKYQKDLRRICNGTSSKIKQSMGATLIGLLTSLLLVYMLLPNDKKLRPGHLLYKMGDIIFAAIIFCSIASASSIWTYGAEYINNYRRNNALNVATKQLGLDRTGLIVKSSEEEHLFIIEPNNKNHRIVPKLREVLEGLFKACKLMIHTKNSTRMIISIPREAKVAKLKKTIEEILEKLDFINNCEQLILKYNRNRKSPIIIENIFNINDGYYPSLSINLKKSATHDATVFLRHLRNEHSIKMHHNEPFELNNINELEKILFMASQERASFDLNYQRIDKIGVTKRQTLGKKDKVEKPKVCLFNAPENILSKFCCLDQGESISYINTKGVESNWTNTSEESCYVFCMQTPHNKHRLFIISESDFTSSIDYLGIVDDSSKPQDSLFERLSRDASPMAAGTHGSHFQQWRKSTNKGCRSIKLRSYGADSSGNRMIFEEGAAKNEMYFYHAVKNHDEKKCLHSSHWNGQSASLNNFTTR